MSTQKALVITAPQTCSLVTDRAIPALRDDYILVKVVSVGLNPTDWQHISFAAPGVTAGCDYAGIVETVGKDVKKPFKNGDRICGFAHGCNTLQPADGAFAEYAVVKGDVQVKIPDYMSFQEAATLGVGTHTVGQALYQSLGMALPTKPIKEATPVLIYGGSTATGTLAIQFAKLSGYTVITTCSPSNFNLVRSLGADLVLDYKDPKSASEIRKATDNSLRLVLDCISHPSSTEFCDNALSTEGGEYSTLSPAKIPRPNVNSRVTIAYTVIGEAFKLNDFDVPAKPDDSAHAQMFITVAEALLAQGKIKGHPPRVGSGGLQGVLNGLQLLKDNKVSGEKLIYNVDETP